MMVVTISVVAEAIPYTVLTFAFMEVSIVCSDIGHLKKYSANIFTPVGQQSKTPILSRNVDQKLIDTVVLIAICCQCGGKWQSKSLFLSIFIHVCRLLIAFSTASPTPCDFGEQQNQNQKCSKSLKIQTYLQIRNKFGTQ